MSRRALRLAAPLALLALAVVPPAPAAPAPVGCEDACTIDSSSFGYVPPAVVVTSGATVTWTAADTTHVTLDGTGVGGGAGSGDECFFVHHSPLGASEPVRFVATHVGLVAYTGDSGAPDACLSAVDLQDGRYALPYYCLLHPALRGVLVVVPSG